MTLVIAGERSGVGKTTITLALLAFLSKKGYTIQSFKVGPDYIDPMFHTAVTSRPCRNLDPVLTSETYVQSCFSRHCQGVDYALVEGVMGLFDGINLENSSDFASTAHIARLLNLPILLVIDCSRLSGSVAAIAHGYCSFDPRLNLAGVILNRVASDRHLALLKDALEPLNLPILGVLHRQDSLTIPDRHLGLVPSDELDSLNTLFEQLSHLAAYAFDWERLFPLLQITPSPSFPTSAFRIQPSESRIPLAVARDRAFKFYYPDNLDILEHLGAELIPWSPLNEEKLPDGVQGLYFGGGFPEVFAQQLEENQSARQSVREAIQAGMPTYAECGGLMYLCDRLVDFVGNSWQMVGILPTTAIMGKPLTLGYRQATALQDNSLLEVGEILWGHEFHRSQLTSISPQPLFSLRSYRPDSPSNREGWQQQQLHASYLHLHFGGCPAISRNFLRLCLDFPPSDQLL